jgi:predicted HAD superfamily phosphohydrolase
MWFGESEKVVKKIFTEFLEYYLQEYYESKISDTENMIKNLENEKNVYIQGCFTGHNFWIRHKDKTVELTTEMGNTKILLNFEQYKNEILDFVDKISDFYSVSLPRILPEDEYDKTAYSKFWKEWNERRSEWKKNAPQQCM